MGKDSASAGRRRAMIATAATVALLYRVPPKHGPAARVNKSSGHFRYAPCRQGSSPHDALARLDW